MGNCCPCLTIGTSKKAKNTPLLHATDHTNVIPSQETVTGAYPGTDEWEIMNLNNTNTKALQISNDIDKAEAKPKKRVDVEDFRFLKVTN